MTVNAFIYAFLLVYNPKVLDRTSITRSQNVVIGVECHYLRKHGVSSGPLHPLWMSDEEIEKQPYFSLQLMSDDWKSERTSNKFSMEDEVNMQASVMGYTHTPLSVFVDYCVATTMPDSTSEPRQVFVKNHGCLGSRDTGSRFMLQSRANKLQFQIEASSFHLQNPMYISCLLKAISASSPITIEYKMCTFDGGWREVGGKDLFCTCCESTCGMRKIRDTGDNASEEKWEALVTLGPIVIGKDNFYTF